METCPDPAAHSQPCIPVLPCARSAAAREGQRGALEFWTPNVTASLAQPGPSAPQLRISQHRTTTKLELGRPLNSQTLNFPAENRSAKH